LGKAPGPPQEMSFPGLEPAAPLLPRRGRRRSP